MRRTGVPSEKKAVWLLLGALTAWLTGQIGFNFYQAAENGYGSGFGDGNHRPTQQRLDSIRETFLLRADR